MFCACTCSTNSAAMTKSLIKRRQHITGESGDVKASADPVFAPPHNDDIATGHNDNILPAIAPRGEGVVGDTLKGIAFGPPECPPTLVAPVLRQDAFTFKCAIIEVKLAQAP